MGLFSRRKPSDDASTPDIESAPVGEVVESEEPAPAEVVPSVSIGVSKFDGLGAVSTSKPLEEALAESAPAPAAPPVTNGPVPLPFAPDNPPTEWESVAGLRDNAVLRDALARLGEKPEVRELLGVARQALQGHLFLRVKGDARAQVENNEPLALGVVRDGDKNFMLAFSSGRALQQAVEKDSDTDTSALGQPARIVLQHAVNGDFAGLILDTASGPARAVVPRELIERALKQGSADFRVKTLIASERDENTVPQLIEAMRTEQLWVAVGKAKDANGEEQFGVAEVRTQSGDRLLQLFTHPLEVIALGRDEQQPAPFTAEQLRGALRDNDGLTGVVIDTAGPSIRLSREELAPLIAD